MLPTQRFPDLENAPVLITGGGSGIGAALTEGFLRQGARVAFIDIAEEESRQLCESLRASVHRAPLFLHADLRDITALRKAVAEAAEAHGPISVLVNNAARDDRHEIEDVTPDYWDNNQAINLRPLFFAAQAVILGMKSLGGGSIINFLYDGKGRDRRADQGPGGRARPLRHPRQRDRAGVGAYRASAQPLGDKGGAGGFYRPAVPQERA